jgi:hypothetical protein
VVPRGAFTSTLSLAAPAEFDLGRAAQDRAVERGAVELALGWSRVRYSNPGRIIAGG